MPEQDQQRVQNRLRENQERLRKGKYEEAENELNKLHRELQDKNYCSTPLLLLLAESQEGSKDDNDVPATLRNPVAALRTYRELASITGNSNDRSITVAKERRDRLAASEPRITIDVALEVVDAYTPVPTITVDGKPTTTLHDTSGAQGAGTDRYRAEVLAVTRGPHTIAVTAEGYDSPEPATIEVGEWRYENRPSSRSFSLKPLHVAPAPTGRMLDGIPSLDGRENFKKSFEKGRSLLATLEKAAGPVGDDRWVNALESFRQSHSVKETSSGAFNIGKCQEHLGRMASAYLSFTQAAELGAQEAAAVDATTAPGSNQRDAASDWVTARASRRARAMVKSKEPTVLRVCVLTPNPISSLQVDGKPIDLDSRLRHPLPLVAEDSARPTHRCVSDTEYTVAAGATAGDARPPTGPFWLVVDHKNQPHNIVAYGTSGATPTVITWGADRDGPLDVDTGEPVAHVPLSPGRIAGGTIFMLLSAAALVASPIAATVAGNDFSEALSDHALCPKNACSPRGWALVASGKAWGTAASVLLPVGLAAPIGGALVLGLPRGPANARPTGTTTPRVAATWDLGGGAVSLTGTFQ
jgi:hypothetical protein